jgi:hypothetical protein
MLPAGGDAQGVGPRPMPRCGPGRVTVGRWRNAGETAATPQDGQHSRRGLRTLVTVAFRRIKAHGRAGMPIEHGNPGDGAGRRGPRPRSAARGAGHAQHIMRSRQSSAALGPTTLSGVCRPLQEQGPGTSCAVVWDKGPYRLHRTDCAARGESKWLRSVTTAGSGSAGSPAASRRRTLACGPRSPPGGLSGHGQGRQG